MKRRDLLKKFGIGAATLPFAPLLSSQVVAAPITELPTLMGVFPFEDKLSVRLQATPGKFWSNTSGSVEFLATWDELPEIMESHAVDQCVVGRPFDWKISGCDVEPWTFTLQYPGQAHVFYLTGGAGTQGVWQGFTRTSIIGCIGVWGELTVKKCCEAASLIQAGQLQKKDYSYDWIEPPSLKNVMGVDVWSNHMKYVVRCLGREYSGNLVIKDLEEPLSNGFGALSYMMRKYQIRHCVIDTHSHTREVINFANRFPGYVTLCRFQRGLDAPVKQLSAHASPFGVPTVYLSSKTQGVNLANIHCDVAEEILKGLS